jgi:cephalosporin-C deacetylase
MKKLITSALLILVLSATCALRAVEVSPQCFDLQGKSLEEAEANRTYREQANLTVYLPDPGKSTGTVLVVFPGGGYHGHDIRRHVEANAAYFVPRGIAVIGVRYRVAQPGSEVTEATVTKALADAQQALRLVRSRAAEWRIDPKRIGILGYSAGSHLALTLACHFDPGDTQSKDPILRQSCRPDFIVALCPFPRKEQVSYFKFSRQSPPVFIATAKDDKVAPSGFTVGIAESLRKLSVPVEVHLYPAGGHMAFHFDQTTSASHWPDRFLPWLKSISSKPALDTSTSVQLNTWIKTECDHPDAIYELGEKAVFRVTLVDNVRILPTELAWTLTLDGARVLDKGILSFRSGVATVQGTLEQPGVLQLKVTPVLAADLEKLGSGMASAAFAPYQIAPTAKLPADFEEFWNMQKAALTNIPLDAQINPVAQDDPNIELFEVSFANIGGLRSHGYLAKPKGATSLPIMISQPGMGVHPNGLKESRWVIGNATLGFLALDMSAHDMPMERTAEDEVRWKKFMGYPYIGSDDRMTYYYRQVFLGMIRGIDYMTSRPDWNRGAIISSGASQGGGLALIAAALDARITAVVSVAPALGEHTGPLYGRPDAAPNNLIMGRDKKTPNPRILEATAYYDTCNFARFVKVPVLISSGLIDTACPPMTVLSIYNTLTCPKQIDLVPLLGHNRSRWFDDLRNRFLAEHAGISEPSLKPPASMNMGAPIFKP